MQETITIDESGDQPLPVVELLTGRGAIFGKSGSGKSNSASVIIEDLLDDGYAVMVVDIEGEYWGLKEEYEILHVGADEEADLVVGPEHAPKLAELALEQNIPIILDVSGYLDEADRDAMVEAAARELFAKEKKQKQPFALVVEEIHEYIPQTGGLSDCGKMLVKVGKRGRKHGLGLCGLSQRPADVKKDFITQCDWLVWHRLTWENDTKVVRRVVGDAYADAVQDLDDGEAFLMADWNDDIRTVQFRRKRTFDAGATPDLGDFERPELKSVSGDLVDELEEISEQARRERDRIAELQREVERKEETITDLQDELERARDMSEMAEQFSQALMASAGGEDGEALQAKVDEIREEKNARIAELQQENESLRDDLREARTDNAELHERVAELEEYEQAIAHMDELREGVQRMAAALGMDAAEPDEKLRTRLESKDERIAELEAKVSRLQDQSDAITVPTDYEEFVEEPAVQQAIEDAIESATCSPRYVRGVMAAIIQQGGPVDYETIAEYLGVSTTSDISKAASALNARGVVQKTQQRPAEVDFDMEAVAQIKETMRRREQAERIMEDL